MHIHLNRTGLLAGYETIRSSREELLHEWRPELSKAYAKRWERYAQQLARREVQQAKFRRWLPWIIVGLVIWCGASVWMTEEDFCDGVGVAMPAIFCVIAAVVIWVHYSKPPTPPENPLAQENRQKTISSVKQQLFPDLVLTWQGGLRARIPSEIEAKQLAKEKDKWGLIGEYRLIRELDRVLSAKTLILHSLMQKPGDDLDVVLIGPKGIWFFEVKYLNADIYWQDGQWRLYQLDHKTQQKVKVDIGEGPDQQWRRMRAEIRRTLNLQAPKLVAQIPEITDIDGGIVFTHSKAKYGIQEHAPFRWGNISGWISDFARAPIKPRLTPEIVMYLTDILLKRHQELNPLMRVYSMEAYAEQIMRESETKIRDWITAS